MSCTKVQPKRGSIFSRTRITLPHPGKGGNRAEQNPPPAELSRYINEKKPSDAELPVLVVNSSHDMAKEITLQLQIVMPGCTITYAPTLELAKWILRRRAVQLVVSSPVLPDGSISQLTPFLSSLEHRPDLVVVGSLSLKSAQAFGDSGYEFAAMKPINKTLDERQQVLTSTEPPKPLQEPEGEVIRSLGADIRNDLNNPLQEIVAMVFVAQSGDSAVASTTKQALEAIDRAAQNMASYVAGLEDRIRDAVIS